MSTTDQRTPDTAADPAGVAGWAVPGVGPSRPAFSAAESDRTDRTPEDLAAELAGAAAGDGAAHPIVAAMLTCLEALHAVRTVSAGTLTATEIRLMLLAVLQVTAAVFALRLRLLAAGQVQRVADLTGATSTAAFFAHLTQTRRADANAQVRLAQDLDRRFPLLADALARGLVSPEHVQVAVAALRKLPKTVTAEQLEQCQRFLVDAAGQWDPATLRQLGRKLWQVIDPDGADRREGEALEDEEELAKAKAYFRSWRNGDGTTGFRGKLPDLHADILLKAIQALAAPRRRKNPNIPTGQPDDTRHPDPDPDDPTAGDPDSSDAPGPADPGGSKAPGPADPGGSKAPGPADPGGSKAPGPADPGGSKAPGPADPGGSKAPGPADPGGSKAPGPADPGGSDPPAGSPDPGSPDSGSPPGCADGSPDGDPGDGSPGAPDDGDEPPPEEPEVPYPVRLGHALMDLLERLPADRLPYASGIAATIVVTMTLDQLRTGLGVATLDTGTEISASQARRLACDAGLIPLVLDGDSQPLDVGQEQRFHTKYQRLASATVHPTCVIDGCHRPATQCHFHHPHQFAQGGPTSVKNSAPLCPYHHGLAHSSHWQFTWDGHTGRLTRIPRRQ